VRAISNNFYSTIAQSAGFTDSESLGLGAAIVSSSYDSSAEAIVAGNVSLTGNLFIDADSLDFKNESRSYARIAEGLSMTPFLEKLQEFLSGLANFYNKSRLESVFGDIPYYTSRPVAGCIACRRRYSCRKR